MKIVLKIILLVLLSVLFGCKEEQITEDSPIVSKNITLISPVGGEQYYDGDTVIIKWSSSLVENIQILRKRTNFWEPIAFNINPSETNEYRYVIPIGSNQDFWIKVMDNYDNSIFDTTDSVIKVINEQITLIEPDGNTAYPYNQDIKIKWEYASTKNKKINIFISYDDGNIWNMIAEKIDSEENNYIYHENPKKISNKCRIKVESTSKPWLSDISNDSFAIFDPSDFDKNYFPMQIGNMWNWQRIWSEVISNSKDTSYFKVEIIGREMISNIEYFKFATAMDNQVTYNYYRIDEESGIIYIKENVDSEERAFLQLSLPPGFYIVEKASDPQYNKTVDIHEDMRDFFNNTVSSKHFAFHHWISGKNYTFALNFGNVSNHFYDDLSSITETLRGCIINNVDFGDTTFVH